MTTYLLFGKYSSNALKNASATRTRKAEHLIGRFRGKVKAMYALIGQYDLLIVVDLPGIEEVIKVSTGLMELTGITFTSVPAISVNEFDKLISEI
ncbi:MAG: GYD domain-containing protein [Candidatus Omnitrophica bacterium]|nr:GYD domain-containing protein [Candidatus Omnitrophota bacterium]